MTAHHPRPSLPLRPRRPRRLARAWLAAALVCSLAPALCVAQPAAADPSPARLAGAVPFGVGDENPTIFADPRLGWLGVRDARLIVPWDVMRDPGQLARAQRWLAGAQASGVEPLVSFNQSALHPRALPSVDAYVKAIEAFMRAFPAVSHYEVWDEENQGSEPTSHAPARAAAYFNWLQHACEHCAVLAADLLDGPSMESWLRRFLAHAHRPRLWGLHPYFELDYGGHFQLSRFAHLVRGQIWLTEAGLPVWRFLRVGHQFRFTSIASQLRAARRLLALLHVGARVSRIYYYQWRSPFTFWLARAQSRHHRRVTVTWDSGLFNPDCTIRPIFKVIARALGRRAGQAPRVRRRDRGLACAAAG
jgi:hypothetical protein